MESPSQDPRQVEEVRVAMALNGGISLAVWMGGCAVELDAARRAHLGPEEMPGTEEMRDGAPARTVYNGLCEALKRELVVDLMSGASAGGINGGLLGAAIVNQRRLHPDFLRERWLKLGEMDELLQEPNTPEPASLMQGRKLYEGLKRAFDELISKPGLTEPSPKPPPLDVKLDVTTTNIGGSAWSVRDYWKGTLEALEYRARFRFREKDHFKATTLAAAGRASASFPGAFEPYSVPGPAAALAGIPASTWVLDGGVLDNAPIEAVLDLIPTRSADRGVTRLACYLNADPVSPDPPPTQGPTPLKMAEHVINLPRKAPFVDQLYAIDRATREGAAVGPATREGAEGARKVELPGPDVALLGLPKAGRETLAETLLPAYRRARLLASLEDVLGDPACAAEAADALGDGTCLSWLPQGLEPENAAKQWQWGLRAAQRALHLLLDAIRRQVAAESDGDAKLRLFGARGEVYEQLAKLEIDYQACLARAGVAELAAEGPDQAPEDPTKAAKYLLKRVSDAVAEIDVMPLLAEAAEVVRTTLPTTKADQLFGTVPGEYSDHFIRRALELEVIRRSMSHGPDFEAAQEIHFVQLTPTSPSLLFTDHPWTMPGATRRNDGPWITADQKLLGVLLGHFGGFYRQSWRVNDFMWGRLDAAARVVEMLVSGVRARQLVEDRWATEPWTVIAKMLLPEGASALQRQLIREALVEAPPGYPPGAFANPAAEDGLEAECASLAQALKHDLTVRDCGAELTRIVCVRAAQLEVFAHELPWLLETAHKDAEAHYGSPSLPPWDLDGAVAAMRERVKPASRLLGPKEATSPGAVKTEAHALLVALGVLGAAFRPARGPLLWLRCLLATSDQKGARWLVRRLAKRFLKSRRKEKAQPPSA